MRGDKREADFCGNCREAVFLTPNGDCEHCDEPIRVLNQDLWSEEDVHPDGRRWRNQSKPEDEEVS